MDKILTDFPDSEDYWKKCYSRKLHDMSGWKRVAVTHVVAAQLLCEPIIDAWKEVVGNPTSPLPMDRLDLHNQYLMLVGYALENFLKATIIKSQVSNDILYEHFPNNLGKHKLESIAGKVGILLSEQELGLINRIEAYVKWAGRYPLPLNYKLLKPTEISESYRDVVNFCKGSDIRISDGVLTKVANNFDSEIVLPLKRLYPEKKIENWEKATIHTSIYPW